MTKKSLAFSYMCRQISLLTGLPVLKHIQVRSGRPFLTCCCGQNCFLGGSYVQLQLRDNGIQTWIYRNQKNAASLQGISLCLTAQTNCIQVCRALAVPRLISTPRGRQPDTAAQHKSKQHSSFVAENVMHSQELLS